MYQRPFLINRIYALFGGGGLHSNNMATSGSRSITDYVTHWNRNDLEYNGYDLGRSVDHTRAITPLVGRLF